MAVFDETVGWFYLTTIADADLNPTTAEMGAGTRLTGITNFQTPTSEATVDTSDIDTSYDTLEVGTSSDGPITMTFKKFKPDGTLSDMWSLFTFKETGYLVYSPSTPDPGTGDHVEVRPVQVGRRRSAGYSRNTTQTFDVMFYVHSEPNDAATIDGS